MGAVCSLQALLAMAVLQGMTKEYEYQGFLWPHIGAPSALGAELYGIK